MFIYGDSVLEVVRRYHEVYEGCFPYAEWDGDGDISWKVPRDYEIIELGSDTDEDDIGALLIDKSDNAKYDYDGCIAFQSGDDNDHVDVYVCDYATPHTIYKVFLSPSDMEYELVLFESILDDTVYHDPEYDDRFNYLTLGF